MTAGAAAHLLRAVGASRLRRRVDGQLPATEQVRGVEHAGIVLQLLRSAVVADPAPFEDVSGPRDAEGDGPRRYGFHHRAVTTDRFDEDLARYSRMGYDEAFSDVLPSGARVVTSTRDATCRGCRARRAHQGAGAPLHGHLPRQSTGTAVTR